MEQLFCQRSRNKTRLAIFASLVVLATAAEAEEGRIRRRNKPLMQALRLGWLLTHSTAKEIRIKRGTTRWLVPTVVFRFRYTPGSWCRTRQSCLKAFLCRGTARCEHGAQSEGDC